MKIHNRIISAAAAAAMFCAVLSGCGSMEKGSAGDGSAPGVHTSAVTEAPEDTGHAEETSEKADESKEDAPIKSGMTMTLDMDGALSVERAAPQNKPMGEEGTWTIFVYMCGSDLETKHGCATVDILEMIEASTSENIKFVVETGGAKKWQNDLLDAGYIERYVIYDGDITCVAQEEKASMGKAETFSDFLTWGVEKYPAAKMGLILWNHGGGSITGVCFDENSGFDSLTLSEINTSLAAAAEKMTDKFEFIGFDACLMATLECANILASYSRYMYASQEVEPGLGWDYAALGEYLDGHPDVNGEELGKSVCDSYYESSKQTNENRAVTLSSVDLAKIDDLIVAFNDFSKELYDSTEDSSVLAGVVRAIHDADNFGYNNKSEGYTNMVDLAGIINAGAEVSKSCGKVLEALDKVVIYSRNGDKHADACGLSVYYPLKLQGSAELKIYGDIATNPYYLSFVDRAAYYVSSPSGDSYSNNTVIGLWDAIWSGDQGAQESSMEEYYEYIDNHGDCEPTGESQYIVFDDKPQVLDDGTFGFSLTEESLKYAASVQANVYVPSDDGEDLIDLGMSVDIYADWDTGVFTDNFDGFWFSLPDGQNLAVYVVAECDGYDVYTSPVRINGEDANMRITHDYTNGTISIDGIWGGVDENGMAARKVIPLEKGDKILPLFSAVSMTTDEEFTYRGEEYVFTGSPKIYFKYLYDGDYYYRFFINDIYGDYAVTDFVKFTVKNGKVYYET